MDTVHRLTVLAAAFALAACASTPDAPVVTAPAAPAAAAAPAAPAAPAAAAAPAAPFLARSLDAGRVVIGGQPAATDFASFAAAGITRVVNVRAQEEMTALGLDEGALAAEHGLGYSSLPIAGPAAFTPAALEAFARELEAADGRVLLHCGSGSRAGLLYAAYLVKYEGRSPTEAMRSLAPLGLWPLPMERMLGREMALDFAGAASSFEAPPR